MNPFVKHLTSSMFMEQIKKHLYFRLLEHIKMVAPGSSKSVGEPDMTITQDSGRNLVYFYFTDISNANKVNICEQYLAAMLKNQNALFGVITDEQTFHIYESDVNYKLIFKSQLSLEQMCHYFNTLWITLDIYPPLEIGDYSYTKSGGQPDIIIDKLDSSYLIVSDTAVPIGVAHPIPLTMNILTNFIGFTQNQDGDFALNEFIVTESNGDFFHNGKKLTYLSQLQQCYRRERDELKIDETKLPGFII